MEPRRVSENWKPRVYKLRENNITENWHEIRAAVLERDKYRCYRCESKNKRSLSVHHIIPRREGGGDNMENLITLCLTCHDLIEVNECRSLADIEATIDDNAVEYREPKTIAKREESFSRPDWHKYVYGGMRHSN